MKKMLLAAFVSCLVFPVQAAEDDNAAQYLELCKTYAKEDGIAAEDMDDYLAGCVKDLTESADGKNE